MTSPAHPEVIALLEMYLEIARENSFSHVAISMVGHYNKQVLVASDCAGEIMLEEAQQEALGKLSERLQQCIDKSAMPPQDESLDESFVRYNVSNGPLGHDFLYWLVDAEMTRIRAGAEGPLKVGFFLGNDPKVMQRDDRRMWLNKLFKPSLALIGAVEDERALYGHNKNLFVPRDIIISAKAGEAVPKFKAPSSTDAFAATLPKDYVTITLREARHAPERNSRTQDWVRFADELKKRGETVIFVRDTERAYTPMTGFMTCPEASTDLYCRMALYENAKANLFTSNGPCVLGIHSDKPWLVFIRLQETGFIDSPAFWEECIGLPIGSQYPWSADNQRVIWRDDTFENILTAWEENIVPALSLAA